MSTGAIFSITVCLLQKKKKKKKTEKFSTVHFEKNAFRNLISKIVKTKLILKSAFS